MNLTEKIKEYAHKLGFDLVGVVPATKSRTIDFYEDWLAKGFRAEMDYLQRHLEVKRDLRYLLNGARSIICLGINYFTADVPEDRKNDPSRGIISRYAWGLDYHDLIRGKLEELRSFINYAYGSEIDTKICVDTAPILEREFASRAGLGWIGKNCNLINEKYGSWLFLAEIILTKELGEEVASSDATEVKDRCGSCTRCIDACPTGALIAPRTLDSRRCISYLTIEHKGVIPRELRPAIGNRIFGCDLCQEVCPWNRHAIPTHERGFTPRQIKGQKGKGAKGQRGKKAKGQEGNVELRITDNLLSPFVKRELKGVVPFIKGDYELRIENKKTGNGEWRTENGYPTSDFRLPEGITPKLLDLMKLTDDEFRSLFKNSPIKRTKRRGLLRNVAIAIGNWGYQSAVPTLIKALNDPEPLVRHHVAWALEKIVR